jgi:catechol 2,3-dioxygenase-like lactoylglutathione lyase family enzyme
MAGVEEGTTRLLGVTVHASDVEKAAGFYRDVLGVPLEGERHGDGPHHYHAGWGFPDKGLMFTIWPGEQTSPQHLSFVVPDLEAVHARALENGIEVIEQPGRNDDGSPPGWRDCALRDPVGNTVRAFQEASR